MADEGRSSSPHNYAAQRNPIYKEAVGLAIRELRADRQLSKETELAKAIERQERPLLLAKPSPGLTHGRGEEEMTIDKVPSMAAVQMIYKGG